jgi:hypothetical protein
VKEVFFDWMRVHRPDLMPRYEELYRNRSYVTSAEKKRIASVVESVRPPRRMRRPRPRPDRHRPPRKPAPSQDPQATLF